MSSCQGIAYDEGIWITLLLLVASNPRDLIVVTKTADTVKNTNIRFPKQKNSLAKHHPIKDVHVLINFF